MDVPTMPASLPSRTKGASSASAAPMPIARASSTSARCTWTPGGTAAAPALLDQILTWRDPARPVVLSVAAYNDRAIAFYRRHGFELASASEAPCHADELIPAISMIHRG